MFVGHELQNLGMIFSAYKALINGNILMWCKVESEEPIYMTNEWLEFPTRIILWLSWFCKFVVVNNVEKM